MLQGFDFHIHSWYSYDAHLSPEDIFSAAEAAGLRALAITDHHNMDGFAAFAAAAEAHRSVRWVPAMEVTAGTKWGWSDVVALGLPTDAPQRLAHVVDRFRTWMLEMNAALLAGFEAIAVPFGRAEAERILAAWRPGPARETQGEVRLPNVALREWLTAHGIIEGPLGFQQLIDQAFDAIGGKPAYPPAEEVLGPFKELGGVLILAHPGAFLAERGEAELEALLAETGADGIEAGHHTHSPEQVAAYGDFARSRGMLISGGADIHFHADLPMLGRHRCSDEDAAALLERLGIP